MTTRNRRNLGICIVCSWLVLIFTVSLAIAWLCYSGPVYVVDAENVRFSLSATLQANWMSFLTLGLGLTLNTFIIRGAMKRTG